MLSSKEGTEEDAQRISQSLGHVPSSLYRAIETMEAEDITLSKYLTYSQTLLEKHAEMAKTTSNLPSRNKDFVGREPGLVALEESFSKNKPVVLAANAGLGGIGKTQIAIQYAYRTCPQYNLIWWINCDNMQISYDDLAKRLGIYLTDEEKKQENALIKRVNLYLEGKPGWLLIFDNAKDEKSLEGLLPRSGGHILITSRNPKWDKTQTEVFGIEVFKREESIDLILKVTTLYEQDKEADQLAEKLQDLPLAIAQAAAYIRETGISIQEYIEDFQKFHKALWKREQPTNNYEYTVNVTWNISMEKIQEQEVEEKVVPQPIALPLMQVCSFFAPNDIPREALLLEWLKIEYEKNQRDKVACLADLNRTLELLGKFSMIGFSETTISVHSLVQTVVRDQLTAEGQQLAFRQAMWILELRITQFKRDDVKTWVVSGLCVPHAMFLFEMLELMINIELSEQLPFMFLLGRNYEEFLNIQQKFKVSEKCIAIAQESKNEKAIASSYDNIGHVYRSSGNFEIAMRYYQKALEIWLQLFSENHPCVASTYNSIGLAYQDLRDFEKALEYYQKALKIQLQISGDNRYNVAMSYNNIGGAYRSLRNLKKSLEHHQNALEIQLQIMETNHPDVAASYNNIGQAYLSLGDFRQALGCHQKSLEVWLQVLGKNHPNVAISHNNIGQAYLSLGDFKLALKHHEKALKIWQEALGENHRNLVTGHNNIGGIYKRLGDFKRALDHCQKALKISQQIDENHHDLAIGYNNIGEVYEEMGGLKKALKYHQKALRVLLQLFGENHYHVAVSYNNIGQIYISLGDLKQALEHHQKALKVRLKCLGKNHPDVAESYNNIGGIYQIIGDFKEALENFQEAFTTLCPASEPPHQQIINYLQSIIEVAKKLQPSQLNALGTIYPYSVNILGLEHELTQKLYPLISSTTLFLFLKSIHETKQNAKATNTIPFPCLKNDEKGLIYDLSIRKVVFRGGSKKNEPSQTASFDQATNRLLNAIPAVTDENPSNFKTSTWNPEKNIDFFLKVLRDHGPIVVGGHFGKHCYEELPLQAEKSESNIKIEGWQRDAKRIQNPYLHFIIVVGVIKKETPTNEGGFIYFVDPNDPSDSERSQNTLYKISYKNLKAHAKKSEFINGYGVYFLDR